MSANSETSAGAPAAPAAPTSCRKKQAEVDEGYVKDMMNHIDEFVHASYDEHKSCLQKTIRKLFGTGKEVASPATPASSAQQSGSSSTPTPVVSALPLRVRTG